MAAEATTEQLGQMGPVRALRFGPLAGCSAPEPRWQQKAHWAASAAPLLLRCSAPLVARRLQGLQGPHAAVLACCSEQRELSSAAAALSARNAPRGAARHPPSRTPWCC